MLPQRSTSVSVYFRYIVTEKSNQRWNSTELSRLGLDRVIHVAEVLQISGGVGLDDRVWILKELDDLMEIWVSPLDSRHGVRTCKKKYVTRCYLTSGTREMIDGDKDVK